MSIILLLGLLLAVAGIVAAAYLQGRGDGSRAKENRDLKSLVDVQKSQAKAAASGPKNKTELLARLKDQGL